MSDIVPRTDSAAVAAADVRTDLQRFEAVVLEQLRRAQLPHDGIFVEVAERHVLLGNVSPVLEGLDPAVLGRSSYISKMIAAASVGLFDAALNYLWDELVNELRRRVTGFDLHYFFDVAAGGSDLRKHLKGEDDLSRVDDANLLRAAREIGLLTAVGFQRLDHIRYMRNHASAAHPNQVELTGLDLAQWLQVCIRQVITTPPDHVAAETGRLLGNLKKALLDEDAVRDAALFFGGLGERANTLARGFVGLYLDPQRTPTIADNVRRLWPRLWEHVSEDTRGGFGVQYARLRASADSGPAEAARELLDLVGGTSYLPPELRAAELDAALDNLMAIHHGWNNFYLEGAPAATVERLVGERGDVPAQLEQKYVRTVVELYLGNGYGVAFSAEDIYQRLVERFTVRMARRALRAFTHEGISSLLTTTSARRQWSRLLDVLEPKVVASRDRELVAALRDFAGTPDQLRLDSRVARLAEAPAPPRS
ncbi:hypothetical protein ACWKWC_00185 [Geodermatophilus nigrescens]